MSSSTRNASGEHKDRKYIKEISWGCCYCRRGSGYSTITRHCYECNHSRCTFCSRETRYFKTSSEGSKQDEAAGKVEKVKSLPGNRDAFRKSPKRESPPTSTKKPLGKPQRELLETMEKLNSSDDIFPRLSTPDGWENTSIPSFSGFSLSTESTVDLETISADSEDNGIESQESNVLSVLDSRLLDVLQSDLSTAAVVLPKIHALLETSNVAPTITSSPIDTREGGNENTDPHAPDSWNHEKPSPGKGQSGRKQKTKRPHKSNDEEDEQSESENLPGAKKRRSERPISFACHFHKNDPIYYSHTNATRRKYRNCVDPSIPELRRIKYHFKSVHVTWQCDRCNVTLCEERERVLHLERKYCVLDESCLREGITANQWMAIEIIIRRKKGHPAAKWFEIWDVLFPGVTHPCHPYKEIVHQMPLATINQRIDVAHYIERFRRLVAIEVENGTLGADDVIPERYISAFQQVLTELSEERSPATSSSRLTFQPTSAQQWGVPTPNHNDNNANVDTSNDSLYQQQNSSDQSSEVNLEEPLESAVDEQSLGMTTLPARGEQGQMLMPIYQETGVASAEMPNFSPNYFADISWDKHDFDLKQLPEDWDSFNFTDGWDQPNCR